MDPTFIVVFVVLAVAGYLVSNAFRVRKQRMREAERSSRTAAATGLAISRDLFGAELGHRAPLEAFHVVGDEARVTFAVPLDDEDDEVLFDLLTGEAVEVVRERRHTLPIDNVTTIVVYAGREGQVREVARHELPSPGELPPPLPGVGLSLSHIAHDPFAAHFEEEAEIAYETAARVPADELTPLHEEIRLPKALDRGMRALGTDPSTLSGPDFVLALLRMFGYSVTEQVHEDSFMAVKDAASTYIVTDAYQPGDYPELDEGLIRRFIAEFSSSGAERGMLISDRYAPFMVYEVEANQPKVRFITRERIQRFIDSMAMG